MTRVTARSHPGRVLTGTKAFPGDSAITTLTAILRDEVKPVAELVPDVPPESETARTEIFGPVLSLIHAQTIEEAIALVNGRMSAKSFAGYRRVRFLFRPVMNRLDRLFVQSGDDAERFLQLGVEPGRVAVIGSAKYDVALVGITKEGRWVLPPHGERALTEGLTRRRRGSCRAW